MRNFTCIIVDDEPLAQEILESYIKNIDILDLVAKCNNAMEAFVAIQKCQPDIVFMDIQMPLMTGIEFIKTLKNPPKIVFTTAYREYALEGYELDVFDYLLKPISFERFMKVISKLSMVQTPIPGPAIPINAETKSLPASESNHPEDFCYLNVDKKMIKVHYHEILYIESIKDYIRVKRETGKELITHMQISQMEEKLTPFNFLRVHRSFIVNFAKIDSFTASYLEVKGCEVPIGRNYKSEVFKKLQINID